MKRAVGMSITVLVVLFIGFLLTIKKDSAAPSIFETPYRTQVQTEFEARMKEEGVEVNDDFWLTSINGETPQAVLDQKARELYRSYQLLSQYAKDIGIALEKIDLHTAEWQEVSLRYLELKQIAVNDYLQSVTYEQAKAYYEEHKEDYRRQATIKGTLSIWKDSAVLSQEDLVIDEENVRLVTEQYGELEKWLSDMTLGQQVVWQQEDVYYTFVCREIEEKGIERFEAVSEAVAIQYAEEQIDHQLAAGKLEL